VLSFYIHDKSSGTRLFWTINQSTEKIFLE
jgi:hypothetical protein